MGAVGDPRRSSTVYLCRREHKYEVSPAVARELRDEIAKHLPLFSYIPGRRDSHITTVYFDTRNRDLYHRAERSFDDNFKIRVKEYYYPRADAPGETGDGWTVRGEYQISPFCYVELKQRRRGIVFKRRFRLPKTCVGPLFAGDDVSSFVFDGLTGRERLSVQKTYDALRKYLQKVTVEVSSVVAYHRLVYQKSEKDLRVTFDQGVSVHAPPRGLYGGVEALTPEVLGAPIRTLERVILEIKCSRSYPVWLRNILSRLSAKRLSKFTSSVRMLLQSDTGKDDARRRNRPGPSDN